MKKHLLSFALFVSGGIGLLHAQAPLFFSEYAEGSSNNKYLEIYNPTDSTVSLGGYAFPSVSNGSDGSYEYWNTFDEGAVITSEGVYIIAHPSADSVILVYANQTHPYLSNGDDGYGLAYGTDSAFTMLDLIGDFGSDPGSAWDVAGVSNATKDHTLVRKYSVTNGNTDWSSSAGTTTEDSEWLVFDINEWMYLGTHEDLSTSIVFGCTDPVAVNYCSECNADDGTCIYPSLELTISEIQGMADSSPYEDQDVSTSGTVTAVTAFGYFMQDVSEEWSGIFVYDSVNWVAIGYEIALQAQVTEFYDMTQLKNVTNFEVLSVANSLITSPITVSSPPITEEYEGCLVIIAGSCSSENNEYGEAQFEGENFKTNDLIFLYDFELYTYYAITGVVEYSFGEYKVCPRSSDDVQPEISIAEITDSEITIKMKSNVLEIESSIRGQQDFVIYNIIGEELMRGVFNSQIRIPIHRLESAAYIVRVSGFSQLVVKQ